MSCRRNGPRKQVTETKAGRLERGRGEGKGSKQACREDDRRVGKAGCAPERESAKVIS